MHSDASCQTKTSLPGSRLRRVVGQDHTGDCGRSQRLPGQNCGRSGSPIEYGRIRPALGSTMIYHILETMGHTDEV